jgi:hypothetical protein
MYMRTPIAIAGLMVALDFGSAPAFAFQETPAPPPVEVPQAAPPVGALLLGTPGGVAAPQEDRSGLNLFGYTVLPKLNFGLDVLYGQDEQQLQLQGPTTLDENGDVTVLGKVKRRF